MIWLLRHAEAADGTPDDERELTPEGERQARAAGLALARLDARPDLCLTSPKRRAKQTAALACEPLGIPIDTSSRLAGEPFDVNALVAGLGDVLLVGHDPSFSLTLHDLTGVQARMKKGGLAAVAEGELVLFVGPAEIAAMAASEDGATALSGDEAMR